MGSWLTGFLMRQNCWGKFADWISMRLTEVEVNITYGKRQWCGRVYLPSLNGHWDRNIC